MAHQQWSVMVGDIPVVGYGCLYIVGDSLNAGLSRGRSYQHCPPAHQAMAGGWGKGQSSDSYTALAWLTHAPNGEHCPRARATHPSTPVRET